jgi:hypothetical protein
MILYNVTVKVDPSVHEDWLEWMRKTHIPDVLQTGLFVDHRLCRLLNDPYSQDGVTYAVQYRLRNLTDLDKYQREFAPALQAEHQERYQDKCLAFRTLLEIIE